MKDMLGTVLELDDLVVHGSSRYSPSLKKAYIVGFTPQKVKLSSSLESEKNTYNMSPEVLVKAYCKENVMV
jgi:hypothetical protein